jgi:hypothetical protein
MNTAERQTLKRELATFGIKGDYLEGWQPREDLWRHAPKFNLNGAQTSPAGAIVPNQPTEWDHKLRLAKRGVLQWKPTKDCACKACRERDWTRAEIDDIGQITMVAEPVASPFKEFEAPRKQRAKVERVKCPDCDFLVKARSKNPGASMRFHRRAKHKQEVAA